MKTNPSFHLLIPATESNPELCKTLLSSFILSYPPATFVNYGKTFNDVNWDKGTHAAKIKGVFDFLSDKKKVKDDDLVLIMDGYDSWFQLPPEVMIRRYHGMVVEANKHLRQRYGSVTEGKPADGTSDRVQKYTQKVIFGADKICWPNPAEDPACVAVPYSSLPDSTYGPDTDKDPTATHNRPRFLNSGNVIGPAADVRAIYKTAVEKVEKGRGTIGDQFVFAEIFGEQEYQRETIRTNSQGTAGQFYDWLSSKLGTSPSPLSANITINNMTTLPGQRYEYSIGLDYESNLFQTMTHSAADIEFITYESSTSLSTIQASHPSLSGLPFSLPPDLQTTPPPFSYVSPGYNHTLDADVTHTKSLLLPYSENLDHLPGQTPEDPESEPSWLTTPLATNIYSSTIPPLLHLNGDKSLLQTWWPHLWFHPYSRALLRRYVRSTQTYAAEAAAARGGQTWWDRRGGRGGVWTDGGHWMNWGEVCRGAEEEVFADGKGVWEKEEGERRVVNSFGKVIIGED